MTQRSHLALLLLLGLPWACSSNGDPLFGDGGPSADGQTPCAEGTTRCSLLDHQRCVEGRWTTQTTCTGDDVCAAELGCVACDPFAQTMQTTCSDNNVHRCNDDGTVGELVEECITESCENGRCGSGCASGTQLIYVVDRDNMLRSFDPRNDAHTFRDVGPLDCPAGPSWPAWGSGSATPFAMTIDQTGRAWVLYTSGEIFLVNTQSGACTASAFVAGTGGYELFTLGFTAPAAGAAEELFIFGGDAGLWSGSAAEDGTLARLDVSSLIPTPIGGTGEAGNIELTGTGNGKLFGFIPGSSGTVVEVDTTTGAIAQRWDLGELGDVRAYACVHWGGRFYVFITEQGAFSSTSRVLRFDPSSGQTEEVLASMPYAITGAGVSTCAPATIK